MAKDDRNKVPGIVSGGPKGGSKGKVGKPGKGDRMSVASARKSSGDRTQLIIGAVAILIIIAVIVVGLVMYSKNNAVQGAGNVSTKSVATMSAPGEITVSNGSPALKLDVYEDALCPICADLEHQFGGQMAKAVDDGQLTLTYKMVDFLNSSSHSGTYSARALAALMTVAKVDGAKPGVWMAFHTALYNADNQPKEGGTTDLSNAQLADLAGKLGASADAKKQITDGVEVSAATASATANLASLTAAAAKVGRGAGTPTVTKDGVPVDTNDTAWLTNLLPKSESSTPTSSN
ncbi:MAG: thioredoxin domain-containing protein [Nakamurella sp.]